MKKCHAAAAAAVTPIQSATQHDHPFKIRKKENIAPPQSTPASDDHIYAKRTSIRQRPQAKRAALMPLVCLSKKSSDAASAVTDSQQLSQNSVRSERTVTDSQQLSQNSVSSGRTVGRARKKDVIKRLQEQVRSLRRKLYTEKRHIVALTQNLNKFLSKDQVECLQLASRRAARWSNTTVKKALQIRCATGAQGYTHLVKEGYPLPSYRTLCEKVEKAQFQPGLQKDVMEWLRVKIGDQPPINRDCVLALDEMQLRPTFEYDRGE